MYQNNLDEFKRWCNDHKTFMDSDIKHKEYFHVNEGDYYVELNKIRIREFGNVPFLGEAIYKYSQDKKDFIRVSEYWDDKEHDKVIEGLQSIITDFKERNNIHDSEYLPFAVKIGKNLWTLKRKYFPKRPKGIICPNCGNNNLYPSAYHNSQGLCKVFYCWSMSKVSPGCRAEIEIIDE